MLSKNKKLAIMIMLIALSIALFVVGMIILPDTLVVQVSSNGSASNTMPKLYGLILPVLLTAGGSVMLYTEDNKLGVINKGIIISLAGVLVFILTFVFNL